jgi:hypothetical protein
MIQAKGIETNGGVIRLVGSGSATVNTGELNVSSAQAKGGRVEVLGDGVWLQDGTRIDASGATGGGDVLVGGGFQGKDASVKNAKIAVVEKGASVTASARENGDGGDVIVWSDKATYFAGDIQSRGGANGGNGGLVETSGHEYLSATGSVNTLAPKGEAGTWLLDPRNLTVSNTATANVDDVLPNPSVSLTDASVFTGDSEMQPGGGPTSTLSTTTLEAALKAGNVTLNTDIVAGGEDGDITFADNVNLDGTNGNTLTAKAAGSIIVSTGVSISDADVNTLDVTNVNFEAKQNITIDGSVATNGGFVTFSAGHNETLTDGDLLFVFPNLNPG